MYDKAKLELINIFSRFCSPRKGGYTFQKGGIMRIDIYVFSKPNGKAMATSFFQSFERPYAFSEKIVGNQFPFSSHNGIDIMGRVKDVKTKNGRSQQLELETEMEEGDLRDCLIDKGWKEVTFPAA